MMIGTPEQHAVLITIRLDNAIPDSHGRYLNPRRPYTRPLLVDVVVYRGSWNDCQKAWRMIDDHRINEFIPTSGKFYVSAASVRESDNYRVTQAREQIAYQYQPMADYCKRLAHNAIQKPYGTPSHWPCDRAV